MNRIDYNKSQNQWVREYDVKVGDKLKIVKSCVDYKDGWTAVWNKEMNDSIGLTGTCLSINENTGLIVGFITNDVCEEYWSYPYFVLEVVDRHGKQKEKKNWYLLD